MTNDECQMTKEIRILNDEDGGMIMLRLSSFGLRHSFGFRDSEFVIHDWSFVIVPLV